MPVLFLFSSAARVARFRGQKVFGFGVHKLSEGFGRLGRTDLCGVVGISGLRKREVWGVGVERSWVEGVSG